GGGSDPARVAIYAELGAEDVAYFAHGRIAPYRFEHRFHQVIAGAARFGNPRQRFTQGDRIALAFHFADALHLAFLDFRIDLERLDRNLLGHRVLVHPDDRFHAFFELALEMKGSLGDLALRIASLDRFHHAAHLVDAPDIFHRLALDAIGERLDSVTAAEWIDRIRDAGFFRDYLLRAQRDRHRLLGRQRQRLVHGIGMERLHAAEHSRQRLDRDADDVVDGLLRRERCTRGLRMRAQHHRARVLRAEALLHYVRPHAARRAKLRHFFEEVVVEVPEERKARREIIYRQTPPDGLFDVADAVGYRERQLLHGGRACLADVVAGDRHRVPARNFARAELDHVRHHSNRRTRRRNPFLLRDKLLEHVVLDRAAHAIPRHALPLRHDQVHREQDRRGTVHRHRGADLVERNPIEQPHHIVNRGDRNAFTPDLAFGALVVGVIAHQRRHVESGRKPILPLREQVMEPLVGVFGQAEARELAHRPEPPTIHRAINTARVWIFSRVGERLVVTAAHILGRVERVQLHV